jgi:predicted nucleic acid-binding protein
VAWLFWDASALAKRYTEEAGQQTVDGLFASVPLSNMSSAPLGYSETYSILLRRMNGGVIDLSSFNAAVSLLELEVVDSTEFLLLPITSDDVFLTIAAMRKHNLNSTDAAILTTILEYIRASGVTDCCIVAADRRLIRAALAEGIHTINPEELDASDVPAFLAALS